MAFSRCGRSFAAALLACGIGLGSCAAGCAPAAEQDAQSDSSAQTQEAETSEAAGYEVSVPAEVVDQVEAALAADEAAAAACSCVESFDVEIDDAAARVSIDVLVFDGTDLDAAMRAGNMMAYLVSASSTVSYNGEQIVEVGIDSATGEPVDPGALYRAYEVVLTVDDAAGTLDLDGMKPVGYDSIVWQ